MPRAFTMAVAALAASLSVTFPRVAFAAPYTPPRPVVNDETAMTGPSRKRMPYELRSSTRDMKKQRLGLAEAFATPMTCCQKAEAKQDMTQEPAPQEAGGSTVAGRMLRALQLYGDQPLAEVAKEHPEDAYRVFIVRNSRPYDDESPEFKEGLRIFEINCESVRELNVLIKEEGGKPITKMNPQSDMFVADDMGGGEQMDHYWLPGGQFYNPTCPEGLMAA